MNAERKHDFWDYYGEDDDLFEKCMDKEILALNARIQMSRRDMIITKEKMLEGRVMMNYEDFMSGKYVV